MLDYRFPTALQMVLSVAMAEQLGERSTSAILAYGLEANPSFIRKLMVPLTRDGIIVSTLGRNGSIHLGRPPEEITLRDIYLSVIEDKKLWASRPDVPARCVVSANACWYFKSISEEAEQASLAVLARHTVASALEAVKNADSSGSDPLPDLIAQYQQASSLCTCCKKSRLHSESGFLLSAMPLRGQHFPFHFAARDEFTQRHVKHRRQEQTKQRHPQHTGEHGDPGDAAHFCACAVAEDQRNGPGNKGDGGHHNRA